MELDKAIGPDSINNEVLKCLGDKVIEWLTNSIIYWNLKKYLWMENKHFTICLLNKGDIQSCVN